ncbi:hypothetical protein ANN_11187 [Periplaneta americana]|uniref:Uncharacterized protein n=1 Tax=Periplaneta americana TaxID=6978 RepID=A0ABQ8T602_PERAM|nr:hypothetical protein ANN_11187 [Periplaneta americana]
MSPGSNIESYPAFAHIGLRENPGKNLNQITCPDRESNPGYLVSQPDALTLFRKVETREVLINRILGAARSIKNSHEQLSRATSAIHARAQQCIEAEGGTFETVRKHRPPTSRILGLPMTVHVRERAYASYRSPDCNLPSQAGRQCGCTSLPNSPKSDPKGLLGSADPAADCCFQMHDKYEPSH